MAPNTMLSPAVKARAWIARGGLGRLISHCRDSQNVAEVSALSSSIPCPYAFPMSNGWLGAEGIEKAIGDGHISIGT